MESSFKIYDGEGFLREIDLNSIFKGAAIDAGIDNLSRQLRSIEEQLQDIATKELPPITIDEANPLQSVLINISQKLDILIARTPRAAGIGALQRVPLGSSRGDPLPNFPDDAIGVEFYLRPGEQIKYIVSAEVPTAPPTIRPATIENPFSNEVEMPWPVNLAGGMRIYIISTKSRDGSGPIFRVM